MGRSSRSNRVGTGISPPDRRAPERCPQSKSIGDGRLRSTDEQPTLGRHVVLRARSTGLGKDSVANLSQIIAIDKALLSERVGRVSRSQIELLLAGLDVVLGR